MAKKENLAKSDLREIEPETTISLFQKENFFSLFPEQDIVYGIVYDQLVAMQQGSDRILLRENRRGGVAYYLHSLLYVLELPTPISVVENPNLTELSILKQCLTFNDIKSSVLIYKISKLVPHIDFEDYISTQEDLEIIVKRLPA